MSTNETDPLRPLVKAKGIAEANAVKKRIKKMIPVTPLSNDPKDEI